MSILSAEELAAIGDRAAKATKGPWQTAGGNRIVQPKMFQRHAPGSIVRIGETFGLDVMDGPNSLVARENAAFIAAARSDVTALLASHAELEVLAKELAEALESLKDEHWSACVSEAFACSPKLDRALADAAGLVDGGQA